MENKEIEDTFNNHFLPNMLTDGVLDMEKVKNEMLDLIYIMKQAQKVYMTVTQNNIGNVMSNSESVIAFYNRSVMKSYNTGYSDGRGLLTK